MSNFGRRSAHCLIRDVGVSSRCYANARRSSASRNSKFDLLIHRTQLGRRQTLKLIPKRRATRSRNALVSAIVTVGWLALGITAACLPFRAHTGTDDRRPQEDRAAEREQDCALITAKSREPQHQRVNDTACRVTPAACRSRHTPPLAGSKPSRHPRGVRRRCLRSTPLTPSPPC